MMFDCFCFNSRNAKIGKCKYERSEPLEHVFVCVCVCVVCACCGAGGRGGGFV